MKKTTELAGEARGPGGLAARGALFERVMERIHRYFEKLVWDPHGVDDCTQKTLLALEKSLREGTYDPTRSFNRWLWLKAHSVYVDYCRAHARRPAGLPPEARLEPRAAGTAAIERRLDGEALLARLRRELDREAFEVFVLCYGERASISEIARITGHDRKTVRKRLGVAKRLALRFVRKNDPTAEPPS